MMTTELDITTLANDTESSMVFMQTNVLNDTIANGHLIYVCKILLYGFLSGLTLITILGNTLVILAVATTRRLRSVTNCFIVSLSVADLLVGCLVMPLSLVYDVTDRWPFGVILCELWSSMDIMLCTASILNLCCISLDRYFAITRPLTYTVKRNKRLALVMIAVVWIASTAVTCPPLLGWFDRGANDFEQCRYITDKGYVIFSASGSFYIPLAVMLFVYTRIFVVIYRRNKVVKQQKQYHKRTCCSNGCLPDSSPNGLKVGVREKPASNGHHHHLHIGRPFLRKTSYRDAATRLSNSDCLVSLEMVSDSLLAMRPRCGSSGGPADEKRDGVAGGLYRSRSYQFQYHSAPSPVATMTDVAVTSACIKAATAVTVHATSAAPATATTHLLAVPQWTRGLRTTPSSSSSGALNMASTSSSAGGYTESGSGLTSSDQSSTTTQTKSSLPTTTVLTSDEQSDLVRVSASNARNMHRDLRRKHVRGLRMSFRKETKATTTIAVVVGGFVVCWLPFFIIYIVNPFCTTCDFSRLLVSCLTWLGWANSAVNPFIYAFYNMDFRSAFWRLTIGHFRTNSGPEKSSKAVVVYPRVWRSRLKNGRVNGLPSIVMVQSDVM